MHPCISHSHRQGESVVPNDFYQQILRIIRLFLALGFFNGVGNYQTPILLGLIPNLNQRLFDRMLTNSYDIF